MFLPCLRKLDESASTKRNSFSANAAVLISRDPPPSSFSNPGSGTSPPPPLAAAAAASSNGEAVPGLQDPYSFNMEVHTGFLGAFERWVALYCPVHTVLYSTLQCCPHSLWKALSSSTLWNKYCISESPLQGRFPFPFTLIQFSSFSSICFVDSFLSLRGDFISFYNQVHYTSSTLLYHAIWHS